MQMAGVVDKTLGKTEQRVSQVVRTVRESLAPLSYKDISDLTGTPYDILIYIMGTLAEVGLVTRTNIIQGPGRPRASFLWRRGNQPGHDEASGEDTDLTPDIRPRPLV